MNLGGKLGLQRFQQVTKVNYSEELEIYSSGLVTSLSSIQKNKIDKLIKSIKSGLGITSLSDVFDSIYLLANETSESGLKNLVKRAHDAQGINNPTFIQFEGFTGDGTTSYINTQYNAKNQGIKYTINNAALGFYSRSNIDSLGIDVAARIAFNDRASYITPRNGNMFTGKINRTGTGASFANTDSKGFYHVVGEANAIQKAYKNNELKLTNATVASDIANLNYFILAANNNGVASNFSTRQLSFAYFSRALTQTEIDVITVAVEVYMNSNEKGVLDLQLTTNTALGHGTILY
jgi:hypothetical protein